MLRSILPVCAVLGLASSAAFANSPAEITSKPEPPTGVSVLVEYQRVGHALLELQDERGKTECGDLVPQFRSIKLDDALASPASRTATAATLDELATHIERLRGIHIERACLDNPLAAGCR